jgi:NTP pyrophosphatase (non-canonical NTP hydrolase)
MTNEQWLTQVTDEVAESYSMGISALSALVHAMAKDKGWWDDDRSDGELIALQHSELSEALEGLRMGNPASEKIPEYSSAEEELADVVIRIMDMCGARGWDLGGAIMAKIRYNAGRPHKHGGKKF